MTRDRHLPSDPHDLLACYAYGAGHGDEGTCLLVAMGDRRILLDCGLKELAPLLDREEPPADLVVCTNARPERARGMLALHRRFPDLPIYGSEATASLLPLNWLDEPLPLPAFCRPLPWRSPIAFREGLSVELFPAGHLPGAAVVVLTYTTQQRPYKFAYAGDFFLSNSRLTEGLSVEGLRGVAPDILAIEGSYGTARYPHRRQQENQLMERISTLLDRRHCLLFPVSAFGLAQELLVLLRSHHQFTGRDLDIWVDARVAIACDTYLGLLPQLPVAVRNFAKHQPLFWDERVRPRLHRLEGDRRPTSASGSYIVIADEAADWQQYCGDRPENWVVLLPEIPGASPWPQLDPKLTVERYLLAQHSDGLGTTQLVHNLRPQHVIFVNGSPTYLADLTGLEELHNRYKLHAPRAGKLVELPIGETFEQPAAPPETSYEGEVSEGGESVAVLLPIALKDDPRWHNFADTGLVRARWQGEELVLRGLSQREVLSQGASDRVPLDIDCCGTCRFFRTRRCRNPASPLYGFQVTLEGYCPAFEPSI